MSDNCFGMYISPPRLVGHQTALNVQQIWWDLGSQIIYDNTIWNLSESPKRLVGHPMGENKHYMTPKVPLNYLVNEEI